MFTNICNKLIYTILITLVISGCGGGGGGNGGNATPVGGGNSGGGAVGIATLTIHTFVESNNMPGGSDVKIYINGIDAGNADANGDLTTDVSSGSVSIHAFIPGLIGGTGSLNLAVNEIASIDIVMTGEGLLSDATLTIDQLETGITGNVLKENFAAFTLRFLNTKNETVPIDDLDEVSIIPDNGGAPIDLMAFVALQPDGTVVATDLNGLRAALLAVGGSIDIWVHGDAKDGRTLGADIVFHIGRYVVNGTLSAPPSNPTLPVAGIAVKATLLTLSSQNIVYEATSDGQGKFSFSNIPIGPLLFEVSTTQGGKIYTGSGTVTMDSSKEVTVYLLTTEDFINGASDLLVTNIPTPVSVQIIPIKAVPDAQRLRDIAIAADVPLPRSITAVGDVTVSASGGGEDILVTDSATITVPADTKTLVLKYTVTTAEYPTYVKQQSQYDDVWSIKVVSKSGEIIYGETNRVNAQLNESPQWIGGASGGTTGELTEELDIAGDTVTDADFTIIVTSKNVGDGALSTNITASLSFVPDFRIKELTPDVVSPFGGGVPKYYSIPRMGETNTFHRIYTVKLGGRPGGSTLENVRVELFQESAPTSFMTMVDQGVDGVVVKEIDPNTLQVRVTTGNQFLPTDPPPFDNFGYRFFVRIKAGTTEFTTPEKQSGARIALWRMPAGIPRVGTRDVGGDDWVSKGTYNWMVANMALLTSVNDVSGEHGRDIGNKRDGSGNPKIRRTHARGTDIDMYHFTHLLGTGDQVGSTNYLRLLSLVKSWLADCQTLGSCTDAQHVQIKADMTKWFTEARTELDKLAALETVAQIVMAKGAPADKLPNGWVQTILKTGKIEDNIGRTLDLGIGAWSGSKLYPRNDHNDHIHIDLADDKL